MSAMCETASVVHSHHHQSIARLASGLVASAYAPDATIEGIELDSDVFCIGVQWHPDAAHDTTGASLFSGLVQEARRSPESPANRGLRTRTTTHTP
jgi:putative glutamine amidotransferase